MAHRPNRVPYAFLPGHPDWLRTFVFAQSFAPRGGLNGGRRVHPTPPEPPQDAQAPAKDTPAEDQG
jgi:hypothetical protein